MEDIGTNCFYIVLVDDECADNIEDCLNSDKQLVYTEEHLKSVECYLEYIEETADNAKIVLKDDTTLLFGENEMFRMKGAFLTNDNGYVMAYSINTSSLTVTNQMIFEDGLEFFEIIEGELNG